MNSKLILPILITMGLIIAPFSNTYSFWGSKKDSKKYETRSSGEMRGPGHSREKRRDFNKSRKSRGMGIYRNLDLSKEQKQQFRKAIEGNKDNMHEMRNEMQDLRHNLEKHLSQSKIDQDKAYKLIDQIADNQKEMLKQRIKMITKIRSLLTKEQKQKLDDSLLFEEKDQK